jgi:hypothetical protein
MFIYLDQSDWAALHAGSAREAEAALRELGERGQATYIISGEHVLETRQLGRGGEDRFAFLRRFPGAALTGNVTDALLTQNASRLARHVQGHALATMHLDRAPPSSLHASARANESGGSSP